MTDPPARRSQPPDATLCDRAGSRRRVLEAVGADRPAGRWHHRLGTLARARRRQRPAAAWSLCRLPWEGNVGELWSNPCLYFPVLGDAGGVLDVFAMPRVSALRRAWWKACAPRGALVVAGGGGLLQEPYREALRVVGSGNRLIGWGVGVHGSVHGGDAFRRRYLAGRLDYDPRPRSPEWARCFEVLGARDVGVGSHWVPCASCMHELFDHPRTVCRDVVVFHHAALPLALAGAPVMSNDHVDLEATLDFLGSAATVVTNSWHGMYWAVLLGRRVLAVPWCDKFHGLPWEVAMSTPGELERNLDRARAFPDALAEARAANEKFWRDIVSPRLLESFE